MYNIIHIYYLVLTMDDSKKLTLESLKNLTLDELEEAAYALQIDYIPPLTEDQRERVSGDIEYIIRYHDTFDEDVIIERRKNERRRRKKSCTEDKTSATQNKVGLLSDMQLVFLPHIEFIRDKTGIVIDKKLTYFCLDRYDVQDAITRKVNPLASDTPLTKEQLEFLITQRDADPYPKIDVQDFFEEIESRIGNYKPPVIPKYVELGAKLEELLKLQVGDFLNYDLNLISRFAGELTVLQYKEFMRFYKVNIDIDVDGEPVERNDAAVKSLQSLINLYKLKEDYPTAVLITMSIGDYMYMIDHEYTYQELVDSGDRLQVVWEPVVNVQEKYYGSGEIKSSVPLNDEGNMDGMFQGFYRNGDNKERGEYKNGKKDGVHEEWYKNGQPKSKGEWKNGKEDGVWEEWHENGQLSSKGKYKNGEEDGIWEQYNDDGSIKKPFGYLSDIKEGPNRVNELLDLINNYLDENNDNFVLFWAWDEHPIHEFASHVLNEWLAAMHQKYQEWKLIDDESDEPAPQTLLSVKNGQYRLELQTYEQETSTVFELEESDVVEYLTAFPGPTFYDATGERIIENWDEDE